MMNRLAKSLVRLYPAEWRKRYASELEALIEDAPPGWSAHFDLLKGAIRMQFSTPSFPKLALVLSVAGLLAGLAASYVVMPRYTSTALLAYEDEGGSAAGGQSPAEHVMEIENVVLSRTSLSNLIRNPRLALYPEDVARMPIEDVVEKMHPGIQVAAVNSDGRAMVFRIGFTYRRPDKAQAVVYEMVTRFMEENAALQRRQSLLSQTKPREEPLLRRIAQLESRIADLERRIGLSRTDVSSGNSPAVVLAGAAYGSRNNIVVIDPPNLPVNSIYPNRSAFVVAGLIVGFVVAIIIAISRRRFQATAPLPASFG
jgi:capsular polysaccharide biosynthesis protein